MAVPLRPLPSGGGRSRRLVFPGLRTTLLILAGVVAVNLMIAAIILAGDTDQGPALPAEIERLLPARNSVIRPQEDVGADLQDDHTGVLFVDGVEIPLDQLRITPGLGQVSFRPGSGKEIERLAPGPHSATIEYWRQDLSRDQGRSFTWQFTAG
jgi:hypothetical protein